MMAMLSLALIWADGGYVGNWSTGPAVAPSVEIVRNLGIKMFQVLPRRWVVERTFAWKSPKCRRPRPRLRAQLPETSEAMIKWAMTRIDGPTTSSRHPAASRGSTPQPPA